MSAATWDEYRAIIRRPASTIDSEKARTLGWVAEAGPIRGDVKSAEAAALERSEETLASIMGMEHRIVTAEPWLEIER
jgi:hypothetical protein